jgi:hypothetical protein
MPTAEQKRFFGPGPAAVPFNNANSAPLRRCEACLSEYPLQQFRRRHRGKDARMRQCRSCHNLRERVRRAGVRHRLTRRQMARAMTRLKNSATAARVPVFCAEMVEQLGGAEGFLNTWKTCIDRDLQTGGLPAFRHIATLLRFMEYCEPQPVDYSTMSDDELMQRAIAAGFDPD